MPFAYYKPETKLTTTFAHPMHCCALMELDYLSQSKTPLEALQAIGVKLYLGKQEEEDGSTHARIVIFSANVVSRGFQGHHDNYRTDNYGQALADYIHDKGLGTVISTEPVRNFTDNTLKVWVWNVNFENFKAHLTANGVVFPEYIEERDYDDDDDEVDDD